MLTPILIDTIDYLKENKELTVVSYQAINQRESLDKKLHSSYSSDWFQGQSTPCQSLFVILSAASFIDSQLFDSHLGASSSPTMTRKSRLFSLQTFKECFHCILNCLGLPYSTECPHQFTIPSSIYYDDHDPKCLICTFILHGIL